MVMKSVPVVLFVNQRRLRRRRSWGCRRDRKGKPRVPALGPVLSGKLPVPFQAEETLHASNGKNVSDLRSDAGNTGFKTTDTISGTTVTANLVVDIADSSDENLLGQELRRSPIHMKVDTVLVIGCPF